MTSATNGLRRRNLRLAMVLGLLSAAVYVTFVVLRIAGPG
jgi:hypothetical protein